MSGIAGIFYRHGRAADYETTQSNLERMIARLERRGPDETGFWQDGPAALGHCMLWNTPESLHEQYPMSDPSGSLVLTADARIDNRAELISALGLSGSPTQAITDGALILAAYEHWGTDSPNKLIGDFAFAIWDARRQALFCARDPMGVKPFYYYASAGLFAFGSEIKALLALEDVPRRVNEQRVGDHVALIRDESVATFFEEIFHLPAAHSLIVGADEMRIERYWSLDGTEELRLSTNEAYTEAFLEVFTEAVRCRLRSAFPVGSALSGGLDSSAIVGVARQILNGNGHPAKLHTFSAVFPRLVQEYPRVDESPWIQAVVAQGGLQPHYVEADQLDPLAVLQIGEDEPAAVPNLWLNWGSFHAAQHLGIRVVLSGYDGDTVLSYGHGYLADLIRSLRWGKMLSEARALAERRKWPLRMVVREYGINYLIPQKARRAYRALRGRKPDSPLPFPVPIQPDFAHRQKLMERAAAWMGEDAQPFVSARELHRQALNSAMLVYGSELIEMTGAACGVEPRLPFFDRRLMEFALSLPTEQKLSQGWNRVVMRRAMQGILPEEVQWRMSKGNLSPNVRRGLLECSREVLDETFLGHPQVVSEYLDISGLQASYRRFLDDPMRSSDADIFILLIAVTLAQWLQRMGFVR